MVSNCFQHERYNRGRGLYANDIGLLVLSRPAAISSDVNVFQLAQHDIMTSSCYYIGWGGTRGSEIFYNNTQLYETVKVFLKNCWR